MVQQKLKNNFMNKNIVIAIFILSFLQSCIFNGDHLGSGYLYFYEQEYRKENCILKETKNKGSRDVIIFPTIILIEYDKDYILALQQRTKEADDLFSDYDLYNNQIKNKYQLWIIDKNNNKIYGPLNYQEYYKKVNELKINPKIQLKIPTNLIDSLNFEM